MMLRMVLIAAAVLAVPASSFGGRILSEEVSSGMRDPLAAARPQENLLDSMDLHSLSPSARFLALPRPMVTPELARAMHAGQNITSDAEWRRIIRNASKVHQLPEALIASVIRTESAFQATAVSSKGAQGAMQIMPGTQEELGLDDPYDAEANVMAGCAYLRRQLDRFGSLDLALAAYNAGPSNVLKYGGIPPFAETKAYIKRVTSGLAEGQR